MFNKQMENTIMIFNTFEDSNIVDYRSDNILERLNNYNFSDKLKNATLNENEFVEGKSYKSYNSPNFWDLILLINQKNGLFDMFFDNDTLNILADEITNEYFYGDEPYQGPITQTLIDEYRDYIYNTLVKKNVKNKNIKLISDYEIPKLLREVKYLKK